jgi:hypothetical protein
MPRLYDLSVPELFNHYRKNIMAQLKESYDEVDVGQFHQDGPNYFFTVNQENFSNVPFVLVDLDKRRLAITKENMDRFGTIACIVLSKDEAEMFMKKIKSKVEREQTAEEMMEETRQWIRDSTISREEKDRLLRRHR